MLEKLRGLLHDTRAEESWTERLKVADIALNHKDAAISQRAVAVAREALGYGKEPWYAPFRNTIRQQAAGVLGKLEPMYRDPALIAQICAALREESSGDVRNALYSALLQLATAAEPRVS